ncbi:uncharacterized protein KZ484_011135 [Pholidichthys leucotaenia]
MINLFAFKTKVSLIVNHLAKTVLTEVLTAAEKVSLNKRSNEEQEKLSALVETLCVDAVEKILKIVELNTEEEGQAEDEGQEEVQEDFQEQDCQSLTQTADEHGSHDGPPTQPTFILVFENDQAAAESGSLLLPLQSGANDANTGANGANEGANYANEGTKAIEKQCANDANEGKNTVDITQEVTSSLHPASSAPPPQPEDHGYALPSLPSTAVMKLSYNWRKKYNDKAKEFFLRCSWCSMLFPNSERLTHHERKSHPECSVCGMMFTGVVKLREHELNDHGVLPYSCDYCGKTFNRKVHRDVHVRARHTGEKPYHCDICRKSYSCVGALKTHKTTHFDRTYICEVCGKSFFHAGHLTRHKLVHQDGRPYSCPDCGRGFTQAANLHAHQVVHTSERQLCSVCGKRFRCVKSHVISKHAHELSAAELPAGDTITSCEVCTKKFPNPSQHRAHQRSHTQEKPFHCNICGKSYRLMEQLQDHRYTHTGEKPYRCSLCPKTFNTAASFTRHRSVHTGETPYSCSDCGKHFRLLSFLRAHLQTKAHLKQVQQRIDQSELSVGGV